MSRLIRITLLAVIFYHTNARVYSQVQIDISAIEPEEIYRIAEERYGPDQQLSNGIFFENIYRLAEGHPYFGQDAFLPGKVIFHYQLYQDVELKYDLNLQRLMILQRLPKMEFATILSIDHVSGFHLQGKDFVRMDLDGTGPAYYQVIDDEGELQCYYHWSKPRKDVINDQDILVPSFRKIHRDALLLIHNKPHPYHNRRSFLQCFPAEFRPDIQQYLKSGKLKISNIEDSLMQELLTFAEDLYEHLQPEVRDELPADRTVDNSNILHMPDSVQLITALPDFKNHQKAPITPVDTAVYTKRFIETIHLSRDQVISVGNRQNASGRHSYKVTGNVRSISSGEGLLGATIYIRELQLGTITDMHGNFSIMVPPGLYTMDINHMAMKSLECGLEIISDGGFEVALEDGLIELEEIMVVDKRRSNVEGMMMGFERITTRSMKEIPVVLGEKDILKVAQMLPGVQNVGEGASGFNVRGGSSDQNMFYINNISVYNTSHLFGFFTAFSPDIINDFSLYKNNIPAKYGGRIASVFEINTREGNKEQFFFQGGISPVTGHMSMEGPLVKKKVSFVASVRSTYSDWLLRRIQDQDISNSNASFWDGTLGINGIFNEKNHFRVFIYQSGDHFSFSNRNEYSYANRGGSMLWEHKFNDAVTLDLSFAVSNYNFENIDKNNITESYVQNYSIRQYESRADFTWFPLENHRIDFGMTSSFYDLNRGHIFPFGEASRRIPIDLGREKGLENALYISDEFSLHPRLNLLLGIRYSQYDYLGPGEVYLYEEGMPFSKYTAKGKELFDSYELIQDYDGLAPRIALNFRLGNDASIKASYNRLKQYLFLLSNTIALSPTDQWKLTDRYLEPPRSDQVSLGYYRDFKDDNISLSVEAYRKWIHNVVEYQDGVNFISGEPLERQTLQGIQDTKGIEIMLRKNSDKLTGWMSYTYSRSIATFYGGSKGFSVNGGMSYPSNYDRPHSFNMVSTYRISRRLSFSANVVYTSGRPVTLPVALYFSEGQQYLYYSSRNKYRVPDYFRIDLSVNLEGNLKFKKLAHSFWMLNVYNVTGRENAYSIFYEARNGWIRGYKLSVFAQPIVTLSWNFKFGNYNSD